MTVVLVIDDDPRFREITKRQLEKRNFQVLTAEDGQAAKDIAAQEQLDIILLDFMMPGKTGDVVARELIDMGLRVPFIFISGADPNLLTDIDFNGMLMAKPIDFKELEKNIGQLLAQQETKTAS